MCDTKDLETGIERYDVISIAIRCIDCATGQVEYKNLNNIRDIDVCIDDREGVVKAATSFMLTKRQVGVSEYHHDKFTPRPDRDKK